MMMPPAFQRTSTCLLRGPLLLLVQTFVINSIVVIDIPGLRHELSLQLKVIEIALTNTSITTDLTYPVS